MADTQEIAKVAYGVAGDLRRLSPGSLAELRRMTASTVAPAFWRLATRYQAIDRRWLPIVKIQAILTPKGQPEKRPAVTHKVPLGRALCDGGDRAWPPLEQREPRPVVSEGRLARLLATRAPQRADALTRVARLLQRHLPPDTQIDPGDIAWAILNPDNTENIAKWYYRRLDQRPSKQREEQAQ